MTINKAYIKYTRKVHWLTFCNNVTWGSRDLITGIINLSNFSHTAGLLLRNLFSILSPIPPAAPTFGEPYVAWNTLQQPPILTPPASPSLRFFTCSTACLQGVTWSGEGRKRGKGKADKPYSVATIGPMILLTLIFLFKSSTLISHHSNIVVKKSLLKPWEENKTCHHYTMLLNTSKSPSTNICKTVDLAFHSKCPQRPYTIILSPLLPSHCNLWTCKSTVIICWRKPCSHYLANTAFLILTSVENILFLILCYIGCTLRINYEVGQIHLHFIDDFFSTVNII